MSWPWGAYLGEEGLKNGISAKISSWQRIGPNVIPHVAKATGVYLNSMLAVPRRTAPATTRRSC
jgi:branched-chain amino acid aminotransferase